MKDFDRIVNIVAERKLEQSPLIAQMREIQLRYDGDYVIPVPSSAEEPTLPPLTPALIAEAVDNIGMRAASVRPTMSSPVLSAGKETGVRSREYAHTRVRALQATYHHSKMLLLRRRYFRHLAGYATSCLVVIPDMKNGCARVEMRDPLSCLPERKAPEDVSPPENVAFVFRHSSDWLRRNFPQTREEQGGPIALKRGDPTMWETVEWVDGEHIVTGLLGPANPEGFASVAEPFRGAPHFILGAWDNKAGCVPAVIPYRVTLSRIASQVQNVVGMTDLMARLVALDILAQEKAIFPDTYIIGRNGAQPRLVGGVWHDGRTGLVNMLQDVDAIGQLRQSPDQGTRQLVDRLERNARVSTGLVPQFGGESYGALRTGRGIDSLMGAAVDPRVQELHEIDEMMLPQLNAAILGTYKGWWGSKSFSMFSGIVGDESLVEFTPNVHFETDETAVAYSIAGSDVQQTTVVLGQMLQTGAISKHTFRSKHPYVVDPEGESRRIDEETMEEAFTQAVLSQAAAGALPLPQLAIMERHRRSGKSIFEAVELANREIQEMQAQQAPPEPTPEQMPGLGAPAAPMQGAPQPANADAIRQMLGAMR